MKFFSSANQLVDAGNPVQLVSMENPEILIIQPVGGDIYVGAQSSGLRENGFILVAGQTLAFGRTDFVAGNGCEFWAAPTNNAVPVSVRVTHREG